MWSMNDLMNNLNNYTLRYCNNGNRDFIFIYFEIPTENITILFLITKSNEDTVLNNKVYSFHSSIHTNVELGHRITNFLIVKIVQPKRYKIVFDI